MDSQRQMVQYLCTDCNQTRNLMVDSKVHTRRKELKVNGLAPYIDIHADTITRRKHGVRLFIDKNFHVRSFDILKTEGEEEEKPSLLPSPGKKTKKYELEENWNSWIGLNLKINNDRVIYDLKSKVPITSNFIKNITVNSDLGTVQCEFTIQIDGTVGFMDNITEWISKFCNLIEAASSISDNMLANMLQFIDQSSYKRISRLDEEFMATLVDNSSVIVPHKETLKSIQTYKETLENDGVILEKLDKFLAEIMNNEEYNLDELIRIYNKNMEPNTKLTYLYQIFLLQGFDYHSSYTQLFSN